MKITSAASLLGLAVLAPITSTSAAETTTTGLRHGRKANEDSEDSSSSMKCITRHEMVLRIQSFADAVPAISQLYWTNGGGQAGSASVDGCREAINLSNKALFGAYRYPDRVNFKPTLTTAPYTYRTTRPGALSYFVGTECLNLAGQPGEQFPKGNDDGSLFQENGFALNNKGDKKGWVAPTVWDDEKFWFNYDLEGGPFCHTAMAMGQLCFTQGDGSGTACVDKTYVFQRDEEGNVVLVSHHSSKVVPVEDSLVICQNNEEGPSCSS